MKKGARFENRIDTRELRERLELGDGEHSFDVTVSSRTFTFNDDDEQDACAKVKLDVFDPGAVGEEGTLHAVEFYWPVDALDLLAATIQRVISAARVTGAVPARGTPRYSVTPAGVIALRGAVVENGGGNIDA